jgi:hypothetical protein
MFTTHPHDEVDMRHVHPWPTLSKRATSIGHVGFLKQDHILHPSFDQSPYIIYLKSSLDANYVIEAFSQELFDLPYLVSVSLMLLIVTLSSLWMELYCKHLRVASITFLRQKIYHIQSVMSTIQPHDKVDVTNRQ